MVKSRTCLQALGLLIAVALATFYRDVRDPLPHDPGFLGIWHPSKTRNAPEPASPSMRSAAIPRETR